MTAIPLRFLLLAGAAVAVLGGVPALAQSSASGTSTTAPGASATTSTTATPTGTTASPTPSSGTASPSPSTSTGSGSTTSGATTTGTTTATAAATLPAVFGFNADRLIGKDIVGSAGEEIGDIESLAISGDANKEVFALVDVGGFLGIIGGKTIAIPVKDLEAKGDDKFVLKSMTKQQANDLPAVEKSRYKTIEDRSRPLRDFVTAR